MRASVFALFAVLASCHGDDENEGAPPAAYPHDEKWTAIDKKFSAAATRYAQLRADYGNGGKVTGADVHKAREELRNLCMDRMIYAETKYNDVDRTGSAGDRALATEHVEQARQDVVTYGCAEEASP